MKKNTLLSVCLLVAFLASAAFAITPGRAAAIKKELVRLNKAYSRAKSAKQKKLIAAKMLAYKAELNSSPAIAPSPQPQDNAAQIAALKKEVARLNKAYSRAKSAKQKKEIAAKMLAYKARLKTLQSPPEPAVELPPPPPPPVYVSSLSLTAEAGPATEEARNFNAPPPPPPPAKKRLMLPQVGVVASTIYLGGEALLFPGLGGEVAASAGYGLGSGYSLTLFGLGVIFDTGADTFVETAVLLANYSQRVETVPGLQNAVDGRVLGFGLYGGETLGNWRIKVGFSTCTGVCISAGYLF